MTGWPARCVLLRSAAFSLFVEVLEELFKLGPLFRREDRAYLIASLLMDPLELRIGLLVKRLGLGMLLHQDGVYLLALFLRQVQ